MNANVASQKKRIKFHRKVFERIKGWKWESFFKAMWIKLWKSYSFQSYTSIQLWQWIRQNFIFCSSNIKIKITCHRIPEDRWIWKGISLINAYWVIHSVSLSFNPSVSRWVGWSVCGLVGRSVGRSVGRLVGWSVGQSVGWSVGRLVGRSVGRSVGWSVGWLVGWSVGRSVGLSVGKSVSQPVGQSVIMF